MNIKIIVLTAMLLTPTISQATVVNVDKLADAIYLAEGGSKTSHPYGILKRYISTTPRQACINTIKSAIKRFNNQTKEKDFIHFLSLTYCPIGASNDPTGLNRNWEKNVKHFYNRREKK